MFRSLSALALASLSTACLSENESALEHSGSKADSFEQQAQDLSLNANPAALKSANQRVEEAFSNLLNDGVYGARVKRVNGPISVSVNDGVVFDPASALKIAHYTYALGTEFGILNAPFAFQYPSDPLNPNLVTPCPDNTWLSGTTNVPTSIANGLVLMIQNSDNRVTRGFEDRYTRANLNTMMADLGMTQSSLHQFIGCGYDLGQRNRTTARDLTHLYDRVISGNVLPGPAYDTFVDLLTQGLPARVQQVINEEGAKLGKSPAFLADFRSKSLLRWKGGSYDVCDNSSCQSYEYVRSQAGFLTLPIKPLCSIGPKKIQFAPAAVERQVAYARYITALNIPCAPRGANEPLNVAENRCPLFKAANDAMNAAEVEMFRSEIRAAIQTFDAPCTPPAVSGRPQATFRFAQPPVAPAPGIDPDEIDYEERGTGEDSRAPVPGVEPDEIDHR